MSSLNDARSAMYSSFIAICLVGVVFLAYYMSDIAIWLVRPRNDLAGNMQTGIDPVRAVQEPCQDEAPSCNGDEPIIVECAP
jgi:hypothetical protein